jgi:hypothetical protein
MEIVVRHGHAVLRTSGFPVDGDVDEDGNAVTGGSRHVNRVDPDGRRSAQLDSGRAPALYDDAGSSARRTA